MLAPDSRVSRLCAPAGLLRRSAPDGPPLRVYRAGAIDVHCIITPLGGIVFRIRFCVASLLAGLACANAPPAHPITAPPPSHSSDVISADELALPSVRGGDALEAVRRLRPRFLLATRGEISIRSASAGSVHMSLDGGPIQSVDNLRGVRLTDIAEIRYLNSSDAALRFGTTAGSGGVILVKIK